MPKRLTEEDLRIAYSIFSDGMKDIDAEETEILVAPQISAEKALMKIEAFDNLSQEAKDVINTILFAPAEVLEVLGTPKAKMVTRRSIYIHLSKIFRSKFLARLIIKEIQEWVKQL